MKIKLQHYLLLIITSVWLGGCSLNPSSPRSSLSNPFLSSKYESTVQPVRQQVAMTTPDRIAIMLPLTGPLSEAGHAVLRGFLASYYNDGLIEKRRTVKQQPVIQILDTYKLGAVNALNQAVKSNANLIIGPISHQAVQKTLSFSHSHIPWLILNYGRSTLTNRSIYQFGLSAEDETAFIAQQAWLAGFRHPLIIVDKSALGSRVSQQFSKIWQQLGGTIAGGTSIGKNENNNKAVANILLVDESRSRAASLRKLLLRRMDFSIRRRQDIDMIFVQTSPEQTRQIRPALKFYFAGSIPVLALSSIYNGRSQPYQNKDLDGIYFTAAPWQLTTLPIMRAIKESWPEFSYSNVQGLYAMGVDVGQMYSYLANMKQSSRFVFKGYTGELFMDADQQIHRRLNWATFKGGQIYSSKLLHKTVIQPQPSENLL